MKNQVNKRNYIAALLLHEEPHEQVVLIINYIQIKFYKMFYSFFEEMMCIKFCTKILII